MGIYNLDSVETLRFCYYFGSKTAIEPLRDALIGVHLEEGTHEIRLNYRTPGLVPGAVISAGCAACFVLLMLLGRRKRGAAGQIKG